MNIRAWHRLDRPANLFRLCLLLGSVEQLKSGIHLQWIAMNSMPASRAALSSGRRSASVRCTMCRLNPGWYPRCSLCRRAPMSMRTAFFSNDRGRDSRYVIYFLGSPYSPKYRTTSSSPVCSPVSWFHIYTCAALIECSEKFWVLLSLSEASSGIFKRERN